jgi:hypothetical protein
MEGDANRLPSLIAEAEEAILERLRGLAIAAGNNLPEADAIEDALYALHALKTCLALHGGFARAAGPRAPLD